MNKSDLKTGMLVVDRTGTIGMVLLDFMGNKDVIKYEQGFIFLNDFENDSLCQKYDSDCDIMKVYTSYNYTNLRLDTTGKNLIWERKEFRPHIKKNKTPIDLGVLGTEINICDAVGQNLMIGDWVNVYSSGDFHNTSIVIDMNDGCISLSELGDISNYTESPYGLFKIKDYSEITKNNYVTDDGIEYVLKEKNDEKIKHVSKEKKK